VSTSSGSVNLSELLSILWHRKWVVVVVTALAIGGAVLALRLITPVYESTSTVALSPGKLDNDLVFFQTVDAIVPIYATAAKSTTTLDAAEQANGGRLADISVRTFEAAPIMKIDARGTDRRLVQQSAQAVTDVLQARVERGEVGIQSLNLAQIDRPVLSASPVFPDGKLTIVVALLLGLALGVATALLQENLSTRIRTREDLAAASGLPVYAELPTESALNRPLSPEVLATNPSLRTISEALRDLRTNLSFANGELGSVAVTSPEGSHGKTTVAFGLAVTLARAGKRTLLVDADLRRGRVAEMLDLERAPGLYEALTGAPLEDGAIRRTSLDGLDVMTGGRAISDPGELLNTRFPELLEELEQRYDTVVIDTTPLVPINDARLIASVVDATVIVASSGGTTRGSVQEAVHRLALISVSPTAVVLNRSKSRGARAYYGHELREGELAEYQATVARERV
jgi:capsular exopolysaccharide synthesis family protein